MFKTSKILLLSLLLTLTVNVLPSYTLHSDEWLPRPIRWNERVIRVAISESLSGHPNNISASSDIREALRKSFSTWESVSDFRFEIVNSSLENISRSGPNGDGVNLITIAATPENVLLFNKDPNNLSAATRVFYNRNGAITEADIALNPYEQFSTDGTFGTYDLESTLTHEIGHLLGLDHSMIAGATMFENYGKNGLFGMPNYGARTLSGVDIGSLRALYGSVFDDEECCQTLEGRVLIAGGEKAVSGRIWLEDAVSGEAAGFTWVKASGDFSVTGLPAGRYRVLFDGNGGSSAVVPDVIDLPGDGDSGLKINARTRSDGSSLKYIGLNGILSEQPVPLNSGKTFRVYLGGTNINSADVRIGIDSPFFRIDGTTVTSYDYGRDLAVFSVDVQILAEAPTGIYSIFLETRDGEREYLPGSLAVETFVNPWSRFTASF